MTPDPRPVEPDHISEVARALSAKDLAAVTHVIDRLPSDQAVLLLERLGDRDRAVVYRLLPKDRALEVFESLDASLQGHLVQALQDDEVVGVFDEMDPDDRVTLLDELPASVATRLLQRLTGAERDLTSVVLGYPQRSIGRRMSPEYISTHPDLSAGESLERVRRRLRQAETVYTVPVTDDARRLLGVVSLRDLMEADAGVLVAELMRPPHMVQATRPPRLPPGGAPTCGCSPSRWSTRRNASWGSSPSTTRSTSSRRPTPRTRPVSAGPSPCAAPT